MEDKIKIELKFLKNNLIIITSIIGLLVVILIINYINFCKPAVLYINSRAVCQTYGINKNKCKIKVNYCGEDESFYHIKINNNGKTEEEYINKNVVKLITFLGKK